MMNDEIAPPADPWLLFDQWYGEAERREPNDANAMALATANTAGMPSVRMVLMKGHGDSSAGQGGVVFFTHSASLKGMELAENAQAAVCFHWKSLRRQVRMRGAVEMVSAGEADAYFASRPRDSQLGAWASKQSQTLDRRETLETAVRQAGQEYEGQPVPRPEGWNGYRLKPVEIEFWADRVSRLHDRVVYRRADPTEPWRIERLYP